MAPTNNLITFFAYVSFFPQLVAGPIERATHLIPQFQKKIQFNYSQAVDGSQRILWGFFKKIVIADTCALPVNHIFANYSTFSADVLLLGAFLFAFQIYCDFSGYSDIAIGVAALFGIEIMENFKKPYFARNIMEFWKRWHISLSTWFRDYLYIPLGGNRLGLNRQIFNMMVVFVVSGLWHGANWTFVIWGLIHGLFYIPTLFIKDRNEKKQLSASPFPDFKTFLLVIFNFIIVLLAWVFFRAEDLTQAAGYLGNIFTEFQMLSPFTVTKIHGIELEVTESIISILILLILEIITFNFAHPFQKLQSKSRAVKWASYVGIILVIFLFGAFNKNKFIYFQF